MVIGRPLPVRSNPTIRRSPRVATVDTSTRVERAIRPGRMRVIRRSRPPGART
jgi:hypothetical protein